MYKKLALGGTFDHFHKGHRVLLNEAFSLSEKVLIGITSDNFAKKSKSGNIESLAERRKQLKKFLKTSGFSKRAIVVTIEDIYGPTNEIEDIEALLVSENTKEGAAKINKIRKDNGLKELTVLVLELIKGDDGGVISSSRIRNGEIGRDGKSFIEKDWFKNGISLSSRQKNSLKKPLGRIIEVEKIKDESSSVGDVVTKAFNERGFSQKLSVVDFNIGRKKIHNSISDLKFKGKVKKISLKNKAGEISKDSFKKISDFFKSGNERTVLVVDGEEDLLVLPIILSAPLGFNVYYGQPNEGVVEIFVDERKKQEISSFLRLD